MTMLAVPWYFTQVLELPGRFGILYAAVSFSLFFWRTFTGTLVDRYSRKRIFLVLNSVNGLLMLGIALAGLSSGQTPQLLAMLAFTATIYNFNIHFPNLYALCQELAQIKDYGRINAMIEVQAQVTTVVSGALAGILLSGAPDGQIKLLGAFLHLPFSFEAFQLADILLIDGATYLVSALLMLSIRYTPQTRREIETGKLWKRLRAGYQFLSARPRLLWFGIGSYSVFAIILVFSFFLLPQYIRLAIGGEADVYGSAEMALAIGALLAGLLTPRLMRKFSVVGSVQVMLVFGGLLMATLAAFPREGILYMVMACLGWCNSSLRVLRITYIFRKTPNGVIGRTNSLFSMVNIGERMLFLSVFSLPFFNDPVHVRFPFVFFVLFLLSSAGVIGWWFRLPRRLAPSSGVPSAQSVVADG